VRVYTKIQSDADVVWTCINIFCILAWERGEGKGIEGAHRWEVGLEDGEVRSWKAGSVAGQAFSSCTDGSGGSWCWGGGAPPRIERSFSFARKIPSPPSQTVAAAVGVGAAARVDAMRRGRSGRMPPSVKT
jgi:hypothetical protein